MEQVEAEPCTDGVVVSWSGHRNDPEIHEILSTDESNSSQDAITTDELIAILQKEPDSRTESEKKTLEDWSFLIPDAEAKMKRMKAKSGAKQRNREREETKENLEAKSIVLARMIKRAKYVIIYTGAGISTSASLPDFRGPNGMCTKTKKLPGTFSITAMHDVTSAEPTYTHMAIRKLWRQGLVKHVVSQNCDGLHIRSGIPPKHLSEIHGNMYIELCANCNKQYYRQSDVTDKTSRFHHKTGRKCHICDEPNNELIDSLVLYGERGHWKRAQSAVWQQAEDAARKADLIICLGSSLKTLRRHSCLWPQTMKPSSSDKEPETKLAIVNLQSTPMDKYAALKINGKCDTVMQLVMKELKKSVRAYDSSRDPLRKLATPFTKDELVTLKRGLLFENANV